MIAMGTKHRGQGWEVQERGGEPAKDPLITRYRSHFLSKKYQEGVRDDSCQEKLM